MNLKNTVSKIVPPSIAYCGLYCPKCYKMKVAAAAEKLLDELQAAQAKGAQFLKEFPQIEADLKKLVASKCKKFCRQGGGKSATCPIKLCCNQHQVAGCWQCPELKSCLKLKPQFLLNCQKINCLGLKKYIQQYE